MDRKRKWGRRRVDNQPYPKTRDKDALPAGLKQITPKKSEQPWREEASDFWNRHAVLVTSERYLPEKAIDDPKRVAFLKKNETEMLLSSPELKPLKDKLLVLGGDFVVLRPEEDLEKILTRGQVFLFDLFNAMRSSDCHRNSAYLWLLDSKYRIVTGWALSDDGLWRQHSWIIDSVGRAIETTEPRELYFGFILDNAEAEQFAFENLTGEDIRNIEEL